MAVLNDKSVIRALSIYRDDWPKKGAATRTIWIKSYNKHVNHGN